MLSRWEIGRLVFYIKTLCLQEQTQKLLSDSHVEDDTGGNAITMQKKFCWKISQASLRMIWVMVWGKIIIKACLIL